MKTILLAFLLSCPAFAAEADFTNFSGNWKGECFHGTDYHSSSASIVQTSADSISVSLLEWQPGDQETHSLVAGAAKENFESYVEEDDMGPEQFMQGTSQWSWCLGASKTGICNQNEWSVWTSSPDNKTFYSSHYEMRIVSGRLETKYTELYRSSEASSWNVNTQRFCRYEQR